MFMYYDSQFLLLYWQLSGNTFLYSNDDKKAAQKYAALIYRA